MKIIDNTRRITSQDVLKEIVNLGQLVLEVTDDCNLSCKYCAYGELYGGYDRRQSQYMTFEDARVVIDYLVDLWSKYPSYSLENHTFIGFYGGEPLLNFQLIKQVVEYIESLKLSRSFRFSMTSNCMLLDRYMDFLAEKDFSLLCSLDGDKKGDGYRVRHDGSPSFDKVFANIKLLQSKYPDYFKKSVSFNSVLHNLNSVEGTSTFIKKEFDKVPSFAELSPVGVRADKKEEFNEKFQDLQKSLHEIDDYEEFSNKLGESSPEFEAAMHFVETTDGNVYQSYADLLSDDEKLFITPSGTCIPCSRKIFVKVDGKILQCERIPHKFSIGAVKNGKVQLNLEEIAHTFNSYLDKIQAQCRVCSRKVNCNQCLFDLLDKNFDKPVCHHFMNQEQYNNYRNNYLTYLHFHPEAYRKALTETVFV